MDTAARHTPDFAEIFDLARQGAFPASLCALTRSATGRDGYLISAGLALAGFAPNGSASDGSATDGGALDGDVLEWSETEPVAVPRDRLEPVIDPVLASLDLRLIRLKGARNRSAPDRTRLAALALRLGLLNRSLDQVYRHLQPRSSFGEKLFKHQLVRAEISRASGAIEQIRSECLCLSSLTELGEEARLACLGGHHATISRHSGELVKLMGGHGYLLSGNSALDYLSSLVFALYGAAPPAAGRRGTERFPEAPVTERPGTDRSAA